MSLYQKLAENLQFVVPNFYKQRYFKKLKELDTKNIFERKIEPELLWIQNYLDKNAVFMDVGANVGSYIFVLERQLKTENIFGFEPNQRLYKRLLRIFPKLNIFPLALSDKNWVAEFKIPIVKGKQMASRGTLMTNLKEKDEESQLFEKVEVIKLDDWQGTHKLKRLDFMKIDVEGNEMKTLRGAENTIKKFKPTLMVEMEQRHHDEPLWSLISEIENWEFSANYLDRNTMNLQKLTKEFIEIQDKENLKNYKNYINNIIFIPKK